MTTLDAAALADPVEDDLDGVEDGRARTYPHVSKVFHWLTVGLVAFLVVAGVTMKQLSEGPTADQLYTLHKTAGVLALVLMLARLVIRLAMRLSRRWRHQAGMLRIHAVLYGAMMLVPLLGWAGVSDFGARQIVFGLSLPAIWPEGAGYVDALFTAHAYMAFGLLALVCVHIGVALEDYVQRGALRQAPRPLA